jgi:16S rRNA (guanine966-N2)-methyltransferase
VRESLFSIVTARLDLTGRSVLDLYAGSGALGLEALSRGAASATFVESDRRAATVLERNIATLGLPGATLRRGLVAGVIAAGAAAPVDLVLADPPYDVQASEIEALLSALVGHGWVSEGSVVVVERATAELAARLAALAAAGLRRHPVGAGRTALSQRVPSSTMGAAPPHRFALHRRRRAS